MGRKRLKTENNEKYLCILRNLAKKPMTQKELAKNTNKTKATISKQLKILLNENLIFSNSENSYKKKWQLKKNPS